MSASRRTTAALATSAALLLAVVQAPPAAALAGAGSGFVLGPNGRSLSVAVGIQRTANYGDGNGGVLVECAALSTGDIASTSLTQCALVVNGAVAFDQPLAMAGPAVASGGVSLSVPASAWVQVCATARSTYIDTSSLTTGNCTSPVQLPGVPPAPQPPPTGTTLDKVSCTVNDVTDGALMSCPLIPRD